MRVGSKHYAIHIPLKNNQFVFVLCDTFFGTIGTNPYILLHVLLLRVSDNLVFCIEPVFA